MNDKWTNLLDTLELQTSKIVFIEEVLNEFSGHPEPLEEWTNETRERTLGGMADVLKGVEKDLKAVHERIHEAVVKRGWKSDEE